MTAIIMCTWKRLNNLQHTIDLLNTQTNKQFNFFIWNNNPEIKDSINNMILKYNWIQAYHSDINVGGIGRFYYAKKIADKYDKIIFIDDDQIFKPTFVYDIVNEFEPKTMKSWFSCKFKSNIYYDRVRITDGSDCHYCGTGICIVPSEVFLDSNLFNLLPSKYKFVEDLWLSFYVNYYLGWKLKSTKNVYGKILKDDKDQSVGLKPTKVEFLKYLLNEKQWKIVFAK